MRKSVLVAVVSVVFVGLFLALPAGAQDASQIPEQIVTPFPPDGRHASVPADEYVPPAVTGIQKTVNIPAAAFGADRYAPSAGWGNGWMNTCLMGTSSTYVFLQAPVFFPKGAKKIIKIEYLMYNTGSGASFSFYSIPFTSENISKIYSSNPAAYSTWMVYSHSWEKASQPVILPANSYFIGIHINNTNRLKSVIITYK